MYQLVFIMMVKTQFNSSVDIKQFSNYNTATECAESANKIRNIIKANDPDIKVDFICERIK